MIAEAVKLISWAFR